MSDAVDVDVEDDVDDGYDGYGQERTSFLPPPTFPASMLPDDGAGGSGGAPAGESQPPPQIVTARDERPEKQGLLIRLGHRLCGFR